MSYLAPYINPTKAWIFSFFATAYLWLLLCNLIFILGWALFKNKLWLLSLLAILLGIQHIGSYLNLSLPASEENAISIMSYNVGGYTLTIPKEKSERQNHRENFYSLLKETIKSDILCLQECPFNKTIKSSLGYKYITKKAGGLFILSDLEIVDSGILDFPNTFNRLIWIDVIAHNQSIRVINVHLQSNKVSSQTDDLVESPDLAEKETWTGMKSVIGKIKRATAKRTVQAIEVRKFIAASPHPTIVVGDFNDTPLSYTYKQVSDNMKDAFIKKGNGMGITYAGNIPGLRIDYILGSEGVNFVSYKRPKVDFSDHYPIQGHFSISSN